MAVSSQLEAAYAICRGVARRAARNFYYAFLLLPSEKRNALSAVYAFMRQTDDITDDPALPPENKPERLAAWLAAAEGVFAGGSTDEPVLLALADAQKTFRIPPELFYQLVQGTAMDFHPLPQGGSSAGLRESPDPEPGRAQERQPCLLYRNFQDLYIYCYYVASVVGLVCIRVFGYSDPRAEELAERCGIAFQLTNIIRDVAEDAALGRIYLPQDDLARFGLTPAALTSSAARNGFHLSALQELLEFESQRALEYYRAADELLPLVNEDCRPALWVLVRIYRRLLEKIAACHYNVLEERIQLTLPEKLAVLTQGFLRRLA